MIDPTGGTEEYANINISLRLGGPPRVTIKGEIYIEDMATAVGFLQDLMAGHRRQGRGGEESAWKYARRMWKQSNDQRLQRQMEKADAEVKRDRWEKNRPLKCESCNQRFKYPDSLERHTDSKHRSHRLAKGGRTACGRWGHEVNLNGTVPCLDCMDVALEELVAEPKTNEG